MNTSLNECPNCHTPLKSGIFSAVRLLDENQVRLINVVNDKTNPVYCTKCGDKLYTESELKLNREIDRLAELVYKQLVNIPIATVHAPQGWEYDILGMVTGQSTTGTGAFSEFAAGWKDMIGGQSNTFNQKIRKGEELCSAQIRRDAVTLGGNAVIGCDIDYSEVGGDKGMLLVCMAGTAVRVKNVEVFGAEKSKALLELAQIRDKFNDLSALKRAQLSFIS